MRPTEALKPARFFHPHCWRRTSIWPWPAASKKSWMRAVFPWCSPALPIIYLPGISVRFRRIPHMLRSISRCTPLPAATAYVCTLRWFPRRRPARDSVVSCPGSWRSRLTSTDPAGCRRRLPPSALRAVCPCEVLGCPLRPLNNVTLAAIALRLLRWATHPASWALLSISRRSLPPLASGIAALRGKLEAAQ